MSRVVDRWSAGTVHQVEYRVLEDERGQRRLEVKGPYDPDFRAPQKSHATTLALRLMALRTEIPREDEADVLTMERQKSA